MAGLTIGKFAAGAGAGVETVRFYQRRGLLAEPERRIAAAMAKLQAVGEQVRELTR
jgi:MerR family transcriptional regulator, mercuric resistance operon regulatory protein